MTPNPATSFLLTVELDRVWVKFLGTFGGEHSRVVSSVDDFRQFLISKANEAKVDIEALNVMVSSTMDFPSEFTTKAETIALANALRQ